MDSDLFSNTTDDQQHRGSDPPARCTARAPIFLRHKDNDPLHLCFHELDRASIFISTEEDKGLRGKTRDFVTLVKEATRYAGRPFSLRFRTLYDFIQSLTYYMPFHQFKH